MAKKIIIIGGGIAGLSAGCYARMNGFETEIYEMHSIAGGLCTAWHRKDYTFDGCLHWLTGSDPSSLYYSYWEEIGAVQGKKFITYPYYIKAADKDGHTFTVFTDPARLKAEMLRIAPEDKKLINQITHDISVLQRYEMPPQFSFRHIIALFHNFRLLMKYRQPVRELASKFKNPVLKNLFVEALDWGDMCSGFLLWTLAYMGSGKAGYPIGGSKAFIGSILDRYTGLGGEIFFQSKVEGIITKGDNAVGILLADGEERIGDYIISAADGHTTIYDWLQGNYLSKPIEEAYRDYQLFPPLVFVSLGLSHDYSKEPAGQQLILGIPIKIGTTEIRSLFVRNASIDPTVAPAGKSVFSIMVSVDYSYWESIPYHSEAYKAEKDKIGMQILAALEEYYPGITNHAEVMDIATPHTFIRYTGNWKASYEGWLMTARTLKQNNLMTLPGLTNFFMVGHWVSPGGGLPSGLFTGRKAISLICKAEHQHFHATKP